ncbi:MULTISPECIES: hypothetical protein [unclassified Legionella]|uniref:hypothetical protein n=1 Tax=unclassified Legionella TaxID=2622702 RepID=UPI0010556308|nr:MULTISPECIES: hypothetical protein [unclassified Legionella]MDI9819876.1 hypothetical protein [Legionella sp. PL877]
MSIKRLPAFLWEIDPGYFRLKQAVKTIIAIVVALWLVGDEPLSTKAIAGVSCGISMQGSFAKAYYWRIVQVISFDLIYFSSFILGLGVRETSGLKAVVFIVLGFVVNYCRRFGLQTNVAPLMVWILCFLATILPLGSAANTWSHIEGLIIGLVVSAVAVLVVFPENYCRLFINNSNRLFQILAGGLKEMRRHLLIPPFAIDFESLPFVRSKASLNRLLESNLSLDQSELFSSQEKRIGEIIIHQYALVHAYTMMLEAYRNLMKHGYQLPRPIRRYLSQLTRQLVILFGSVRMDNAYKIRSEAINISLTQLGRQLNQERLTDPELIMIILNLKLSFNLLRQQIDQLQEGANEA